VCHPLNQQFFSRFVAWDFVRPACEELQALLHQERVALDLPLEDENPLTDEDRSQYAETMRSSVERFVFLLFSLPFIFDCIFSRLHYSFIVDRLIDRSEVIAGDSLDNSNSVIEMFAIPPLAQQQVQWQQERPSLTSTTNTSRSTSLPTPASWCLLPTHLLPTPVRAQQQMRHEDVQLLAICLPSNGRSGIRSANHAAGIIGLIQLAGAHPNSWEGTLGHNQRTQWFNENVDAFFQADGPLGMFIQVSPLVLL
jgi:hypothetical protein